MDSPTPRKRGREPEALQDLSDAREPKRINGEETDRFLDRLQLDETVAEEREEEYAPSEQLVSGLMRNLEKEIAATCSTSFLPFNSGDNPAVSDIFIDNAVQTLDSDAGVDLSYLLDVFDDEHDISPSPTMDLKNEVSVSANETSAGFSENPDLKSFGENWHFEDDFGNYQQLIALYENAWLANQPQDYMNRDFIIPGLLFDEDFTEAWKPETALHM